jgi:hypothetical protein
MGALEHGRDRLRHALHCRLGVEGGGAHLVDDQCLGGRVGGVELVKRLLDRARGLRVVTLLKSHPAEGSERATGDQRVGEAQRFARIEDVRAGVFIRRFLRCRPG